MKKLSIYLVTILLVSAGINSCKKLSEDTSFATKGSYTDLQVVFKDFVPATKKMTMNVSAGLMFYGNSGTRYSLPANAYQTAGGVAVTGTVDISATEYLSKSDMIFSGIFPVSNNAPLLSAGEIDINVTQNDQPVFLKPGYMYETTIPLKGNSGADMQLFRGESTNNVKNKVNWRLQLEDSNSKRSVILFGTDSIKIFNDSFRLTNCDKFMANPNYQQIKMNIKGVTVPSDASLYIFVCYDGVNGALPVFVPASNLVSMSYIPGIPVHMVVMVIVNGDIYGGIKGMTPVTGTTYDVNMERTTPQEFKQKIAAL